MKTCSRCNEIKLLSEFHKRSNRKSGVSPWCKICEKARKPVDVKKAYNARYYSENKEDILKHQKLNRHITNRIAAKRRASKLQRTPKWLTEEQINYIQEFYKMAKELESVFLWKQHVDHIIPLQGDKVSGFHHPDNLQILSAKMNMEKHNTYEVA